MRELSQTEIAAFHDLLKDTLQEPNLHIIIVTKMGDNVFLGSSLRSAEAIRSLLRDLAGRGEEVAYYRHDPQPGAEIITVEQFKRDAELLAKTDVDGHGHPMKDGKVSDLGVFPSRAHLTPEDATHIMWVPDGSDCAI